MPQLVELVRTWRHRPSLARFRPLWTTLRPAWRAALWVGSGGRGFVHAVNGLDRFRLDVHQAPHAAPIVWEPEHYAMVMAEVRPGGHVIDVGAFVGLYALGAAIRVGAAGRVVAIEASPQSARRLRANVRANGFGGIIRVVEAVCADQAGERVSFYISQDGGMTDSAVPDSGAPAKMIRLETTTIDALTEDLNLRPDVIKIDVEGYEDLVLQGALEALRRFRPVVFVECHPDKLAARARTVAHVVQQLREHGLVCDDPRLDGSAPPPSGTLFAFRPARQ